MDLIITKEHYEKATAFRNSDCYYICKDCVIAVALAEQHPLPEGKHWSVGTSTAYVKEEGRKEPLEEYYLSPTLRDVLRKFDLKEEPIYGLGQLARV